MKLFRFVVFCAVFQASAQSPCTDSLYLALRGRPELSAAESAYMSIKKSECEKAENINGAGKILFGILGCLVFINLGVVIAVAASR